MSTLVELNRPLILGSSSPRRQGMLKSLRIPFVALSPQIVEQRLPDESPEAYVTRNSQSKAEWIVKHQNMFREAWVLCADTIVSIDDEVLEKPNGFKNARTMLTRLSGNEHRVLSAFCLFDSNDPDSPKALRTVVTKVKFRELSDTDIDFYLSTHEPFDKAGSYGIQGVGSFLIERIEGCYSNVVGLPLPELLEELRRLS